MWADRLRKIGYTFDAKRYDNKLALLALEQTEIEMKVASFEFHYKEKFVVLFIDRNCAVAFEATPTRLIMKSFEPNLDFEFPWEFLANSYGLSTLNAYKDPERSPVLRYLMSLSQLIKGEEHHAGLSSTPDNEIGRSS